MYQTKKELLYFLRYFVLLIWRADGHKIRVWQPTLNISGGLNVACGLVMMNRCSAAAGTTDAFKKSDAVIESANLD